MRIVLVGNFGLRKKGTISARALPIARQLAGLGHEVWLVIPPWDSPEDAGSRFIDSGVQVIQTPLPRDDILWPARLLWLTLRVVVRQRPDALYAFKPYAVAGATLLAFRVWHGVFGRPVRLMLDLDDWEGTGGWASRRNEPRWIRKAIDLMESACIGAADVVSVASRELLAISNRIRGARDTVTYLPNCLEKDAFPFQAGDRSGARRKLGLSDGPLVLAYSRFLEFDMGRMARVFQRVLAQEPSASVLVVGAGERGEHGRLELEVASAGFGDRVRVVGWQPVADLTDYLASADVAYYPLDDTLLNRAKCPMKLVELLAAGCPVVADAVGQAGEYIEDGVSGRLVPAGDETAAIEAILEILRQPDLARRLGGAGRERIRSAYIWEQQRELLAGLFS